jgi:hypothetical protein
MSAKLNSQEITLETKGTFDLVKGDFSPDEGSEILNELFSKKINFHEVKSFSEQIRFGTPDVKGLKRIKELKIARNSAIELIAEAKKSGKSLRNYSTISIELI